MDINLTIIEEDTETSEALPLLFVPALVGLLDSWGEVSALLIPIAVIIPLTTIIVMASAGLVTQFLLKNDKGEQQAYPPICRRQEPFCAF